MSGFDNDNILTGPVTVNNGLTVNGGETVNGGTTLVSSMDAAVISGQKLAAVNQYNNATFWTAGAGWATTVQTATATAATGTLAATAANFAPTPGAWYVVSVFVTSFTVGSFTVNIGNTASPVFSELNPTAFRLSFVLQATDATPFAIVPVAALTASFGSTFQHFSVQQVTFATPVVTIDDSTGAVSAEIRTGLASANNFGFGLSALRAVTTGIANVAVGDHAAESATTAQGLVALGAFALQQTTTGTANIGIGQNALQNNRTGTPNLAIGGSALQQLVSGPLGSINNLAIGAIALQVLVSGDNNVAVGHDAGVNLTSGSGNTILGPNAAGTGGVLTSGSENILIGHNADVPVAATSNYLNVGGVLIGNTSTKVGDLNRTIVTTAINYAALSTDKLILCTATLTVTLAPTPSGKAWIVKNANTAAITITVQLSSGTIDGAASQTITTTNGLLEVTVDGTNGWITAKI